MRYGAATLLGIVFIAAAAGCGGPANGAKGPSRPLPAWTGHATELFDDAIEPSAVGLELDRGGPAPAHDPLLRERSQVADAVLRVRVDTVSSHDDGVTARYDIGLRTLEKLGGAHPPEDQFTIRVDKDSPSAGLMRSFQSRLGGKTFVAFVREYVRADGDAETHFHMVSDSKEVVAAVRDAVALSDLR